MTTTYSVQFVGYVIQDEFTEYHMKVTSSDNASWLVRRRYREFRDLHDHLKLKYPDRVPAVPGKKLWGNQDPDFVRQRQDQLQVYMNGILALEPDCRTRVLQRFLEIKKPSSGGSPLISSPQGAPSMTSVSQQSAPQPVLPSSRPSPQVATASPEAANRGLSKQKQLEELNKAVQTFQKEAFDLSIAPALLDAGEYAARSRRYNEIVENAKVDHVHAGSRTPKSCGNELASQFAAAAFAEGDKGRELGRAALASILGKGPIATESDLVAFFSLQPGAAAVSASSSSS